MDGEKKIKSGAVLVIGGGIAGIQASLDLADSGRKVYLVEKKPAIGGRMAQLDKTFPTNDCSMCMISPKLVACSRHPNIEIFTLSEIESVAGEPGRLDITIKATNRLVDKDLCTSCGDCVDVCPINVPDEFNGRGAERKAISKLYQQAVPAAFSIERRGTAPCTAACPAGVNACGYIALISKGRFDEALELERKANPLAAICGRVCHRPCEKACRRDESDQPLAIAHLKRFIADRALNSDSPQPLVTVKGTGKKVAVIGSGPAGLSCAYQISRLGHSVVIFEASHVPGGMLSAGIPEYRLPRDVLKKEIEWIFSHGIEIRLSSPVGVEGRRISDLRMQGFEAFFIATGAHRSKSSGIEKGGIEGVTDALSYLKGQNLSGKTPKASRVVVIGGGNAAVDASRTAIRAGAGNVTICYRRSREEMPAISEEVDEALEEGVIFEFRTTPLEFMGKSGKLIGMRFVRNEKGKDESNKNALPVIIPGTEFELEADLVIEATGQEPDLRWLEGETGFEILGDSRLLPADSRTQFTSVQGIFAGGDCVTGPATVIDAVAAGKKAALSIDLWLKGEEFSGEVKDSLPGETPVLDKNYTRTAGIKVVKYPPGERVKSFNETVVGYSEGEAKAEAERCLKCSVCCDCGLCEKVCEANAIKRDCPPETRTRVTVGAVVIATGFDVFNPTPLGEFGYGRVRDVVTSIEFERMLSATGPTGGKLIRPSDNKKIGKIAFIQCVGSRDRRANEYCSSFCCMQTAKEAMTVVENHKGVAATVFYTDLRTHGKGFETYVKRAEAAGVKYIRSQVSAIRKGGNAAKLLFSDPATGKQAHEEFDLVVLSVGARPGASAKETAGKFGAWSDSYGFIMPEVQGVFEKLPEGIFSAGMCSGPKDIQESVISASAAAAMTAEYLSDTPKCEQSATRYPVQRDVRGEEPRTGVFICHCGVNIAGTIDVPALEKRTSGLPSVVHAERFLFACSPDAQEKIKKRVVEKNLNRVVVASCTPRTHEPIFQGTMMEAGLNPHLFELCNIREQCSWVHRGLPAEATKKAGELISMSVAKARLLETIEAVENEVFPGAAILGGGAAGMAAAMSLSAQGFKVHLIEREKHLGGIGAVNFTEVSKGVSPADIVSRMSVAIAADARIEVHLDSVLESMKGHAGSFDLNLKNGTTVKSGVLIVATGAREYSSGHPVIDGSGNSLTQLELAKILKEGKKVAGPVVMIQCVGSRDEKRKYCSRVCCRQAVTNARIVKERNPESKVIVLYRDINTYGLWERDYRSARESGVLFGRYEAGHMPEARQGTVGFEISYFDEILRQNLVIPAATVVFSNGIVPDPGNARLADILKVPVAEDGFFLEAHAKLRPVDFSSSGIFVAGLVHGPKTVEESITQAIAAAGRAGVILSSGKLKSNDMVCSVDSNLCASCMTCVRICPYGAPSIGAEGCAIIEGAKCQGCGVCAAACPAKAIKAAKFSDAQIIAMLEAFGKGEKAGEKTDGGI